MTILCLSGNSLWAEDSINVDSATIYIYGSSKVSDTIKCDGKTFILQEMQEIPQNWYDAEWIHIALIVIAILSFLLIIYIFIVIFSLCTKDEVEDIVNYYLSRVPTHSQTKNSNNQNELDFKFKLKNLDERLKQLENNVKFSQYMRKDNSNSDKPGVSTERSNPNQPNNAPSQPVARKDERKHKHGPQKPSLPQKIKYAVQDASNKNRLMNVQDEFDKYDHTFKIVLDAGSETDGSFTIIEDESIIQNCLNNTDSMQCCIKIGNGLKITKQVPGRVYINGDIAEVKTPAEIYVQ